MVRCIVAWRLVRLIGSRRNSTPTMGTIPLHALARASRSGHLPGPGSAWRHLATGVTAAAAGDAEVGRVVLLFDYLALVKVTGQDYDAAA